MFEQRREPRRSDRYERTGSSLTTGLGLMALAAGLMYLLDPTAGRRRRSQIRDKFVRGYHAAGHAARTSARHARNRVAGYAHEARARYTEGVIADDILKDRVRSKIGRAISHPGSIGVTVQDAVVTLHGPIFSREVDLLLRTVRSVRGIRDVRNQLSPYQSAESAAHISGLQGEGYNRANV